MKITPVYTEGKIDFYTIDDDFCKLEYYHAFGIISGYIKKGKEERCIGIDMNDRIDIGENQYKLNKIRYLFWGV